MLGDNYIEKAKDLRKYADSLGICCNRTHAPFDFTGKDTFEESNVNFLRLVRSLEVSAVLGAKTSVVHAVKGGALPENADFFEYNTKFYKSLLPHCEKFGICVSVENLFCFNRTVPQPVLSDPKEHIEFVKSLGSDYFNICLDIGHSALLGYKPEDAIAGMDKTLLKSPHIHDNDYRADRHMLPHTADFDWDKICSALKNLGYTGELTFEIFGFLSTLPKDTLGKALEFACKIGKSIITKID